MPRDNVGYLKHANSPIITGQGDMKDHPVIWGCLGDGDDKLNNVVDTVHQYHIHSCYETNVPKLMNKI